MPGDVTDEQALSAEFDVLARRAGLTILEARKPAGIGIPIGPHAHEGQRLGDVVAPGAHVGRAPGAERQAPGPIAMFLAITLKQQ